MKNQADYSLYKCPYAHVEKDCGHELKGPEGYEDTYGVWCACGFRGPVFCRDPEQLKLEDKKALTPAKGEPMPRTVEHYQANAIRDQELILEQRDEIGRLNRRINKLEQRFLP